MDKIEGLAGLDQALGELPKSTARATLVRTGKKALEPFLADVKTLAPIDADPANSPKRPPGTLRDSYVIGTRLNKSQRKAVRKEGKNFAEVYAGTNDRAGVQTEFGNAHQAAQPHARPAWDGTKVATLDAVSKLLWDEIAKSAKRLARRRG